MMRIVATLLVFLALFTLDFNLTIEEIYNSKCNDELCAKKKNFVFGLSVNINANVPPFFNEIITYLCDLHTYVSDIYVLL